MRDAATNGFSGEPRTMHLETPSFADLPFPFIDFHTHLTTSVLTTQGVGSLVRLMDLYGVASTVGFAFPFVTTTGERWRYTDRGDGFVLGCAGAYPGRIVPFLCGFDPTRESSIEYVRAGLAGGRFRGLGELLVGKEDWKDRLGTHLRADHPVAIEIYRIAAEHQVPVLFHCDAPLHEEMARALEACPNTCFVWAHCGATQGQSDLAGLVESLLEEFPTLHCDLSWNLWDLELIYWAKKTVRQRWTRIFERFPDRFLAAFDLCGEFGAYPTWVKRFHFLLMDLPETVAQAMSWGNATRLLGMPDDPHAETAATARTLSDPSLRSDRLG